LYPISEIKRCVVKGEQLTIEQAFSLIGNSLTIFGKWKSVNDSNMLDVHVNKLFRAFEILENNSFNAEYLGYTVPVTLKTGSMIVHDSDYIGDIELNYKIIENRLYLNNQNNPLILIKNGITTGSN
jgi:hypothetical protein